jgi:hypothetical protein
MDALFMPGRLIGFAGLPIRPVVRVKLGLFPCRFRRFTFGLFLDNGIYSRLSFRGSLAYAAMLGVRFGFH